MEENQEADVRLVELQPLVRLSRLEEHLAVGA